MNKKYLIFGIVFVLLLIPFVHADITTGLVAYYELENNGTDSTANNNDGVVTQVKWVSGVVGTAGQFIPANNSVITVPDSASLSITGDMTVSLWYKGTSCDTSNYMISKVKATAPRYANPYVYGVDHPTKIYVIYGRGLSSQEIDMSDSSITCDTWQHLVWTTSGNTITYYVNGSIFGTTDTTTETRTDGNTPMAIGNIVGGGALFSTQTLDEIRIYNRALTGSDVLELYNDAYIPPNGNVTLEAIDAYTGNNILEFSAEITGNGTYTTSNGTITTDLVTLNTYAVSEFTLKYVLPFLSVNLCPTRALLSPDDKSKSSTLAPSTGLLSKNTFIFVIVSGFSITFRLFHSFESY